MFFSILASLHLTTASCDVKTVYLDADVEEEIYVKLLHVFSDETSEHNGKVVRLQCALYGIRTV